jgi:hypothetical protein
MTLLLTALHEQPCSLSDSGIGLNRLFLVVVPDGIAGTISKFLKGIQLLVNSLNNCDYGPSRTGAGMAMALPINPQGNPGFNGLHNKRDIHRDGIEPVSSSKRWRCGSKLLRLAKVWP